MTAPDPLGTQLSALGLPPAIARPALSGADPAADPGFARFLRAGTAIEVKAFAGTSDAAGGVTIPEEIDARIDATLKAISPIRCDWTINTRDKPPGIFGVITGHNGPKNGGNPGFARPEGRGGEFLADSHF